MILVPYIGLHGFDTASSEKFRTNPWITTHPRLRNNWYAS